MTRVPPGYEPVRRGPSRRVRRNRALAILAIIVLLIVVFVSMSKCSSGGATPAPTSTDIPTVAPTTDPSLIPTVAPTTDPNNPTAGPIPTIAGAPACSPAMLTVTAQTDKASYAAAEKPQLTMTVTNAGNTECQANLGTTQQVFQISSNNKIVWQSTDCQTGGADYMVTLQPKQSVTTTPAISWEREVSSPDTCTSTSRAKVPAAGNTYYLTTFMGTSKSAQSKPFVLK